MNRVFILQIKPDPHPYLDTVQLPNLPVAPVCRVREADFEVGNCFVGVVGYDRLRYGLNLDRKSTRLNSSHSQISYAVFCLKKKKKINFKHYLGLFKHVQPLQVAHAVASTGLLPVESELRPHVAEAALVLGDPLAPLRLCVY